nr:hypothetical protein [uncultured bacterium]
MAELLPPAGSRKLSSWWPAGTLIVAGIVMFYVLRPTGNGVIESPGDSNRRPTTAGPLSVRSPEIEPAAWFVYLVDISGSTHVGGRRRKSRVPARDRDTPYTRSLGLVTQSILGLRRLTEALPQQHSVIAITNASLYQKPLCEVTVPRVNLFTGGDTIGMMTSIARCDSTLRNIRWSARTDIRGALKLAGLVLEQKPGRVRGIVLVSDLEETLRRGQEAAVPSLHGECVLVVPQITPEVARTPSLLDKRVETWRQLLLEWGASRVEVRTVPAFSEGDVLRFFRECGKIQRTS